MDKTQIKSLMNNRKVRIAGLIVLAFLVGYILRGPGKTEPLKQVSQTQQTTWTCSMHPQIRQPGPGKCPICGMDLIPVKVAGAVGPRQIEFSTEAVKLMEIETSVVQRKVALTEVRMVGKIDYDETRVKHITAWVPGRIDRLFVDFTGISVSKGDHMVEVYSPELISAQTELLQAAKSAGSLRAGASDIVKRSTTATLDAVREKLRLLGLNTEQIKNIESSGEPQTHITINSPMSGIVIDKHAAEGMYVKTGTPIYTIVDFSRLWVKLDAYESDLPWIRFGQEVEFRTEAYPGEEFKGTISFIDPVLNDKTRTVKLRVNVDNTAGKLKPQMFVSAVVRSEGPQNGRVMVSEMAGKWVCPMHPDIVRAQAGSCDICGMDLVTTESLGYVKADMQGKLPLVIPASAPLITGKRAVVYVQVPNTQKPTYQGREIVLGPRAGEVYIVQSGLAEGQVVVTNGNFKIDSAMQIQAKPSMMNPQGGTQPMQHHGPGHTDHKDQSSKKDVTEQTVCPVMGGKIDKNVFTEYKGKKVYFCCPGCIAKFNEDPEKYLTKLPQFKE